mmetsp:Transcript_5656/g.14378  ORF Transcript_5656/g.14378 Transcript_5656/m.14378 type:complete len:236 (+) Transcript_5656:164-871(+)
MTPKVDFPICSTVCFRARMFHTLKDTLLLVQMDVLLARSQTQWYRRSVGTLLDVLLKKCRSRVILSHHCLDFVPQRCDRFHLCCTAQVLHSFQIGSDSLRKVGCLIEHQCTVRSLHCLLHVRSSSRRHLKVRCSRAHLELFGTFHESRHTCTKIRKHFFPCLHFVHFSHVIQRSGVERESGAPILASLSFASLCREHDGGLHQMMKMCVDHTAHQRIGRDRLLCGLGACLFVGSR